MAISVKESKLLKKVKKQVEIGISNNKDNMDVYRSSQKFLFTRDGQFTQDELDYYENHRKPKMVANREFGEYTRLCGAQRKLKRAAKLRPLPGYTESKMNAEELDQNIDIRRNLLESITFHSDANKVYEQVFGMQYFGLGACRVTRDFEDSNSFDQRLKIELIENPATVYWDPSARDDLKVTGSWMGFYRDIQGDELQSLYKVDLSDPTLTRDMVGDMVSNGFSWVTNPGDDAETYRVCYHYMKKHYSKKIALLTDGINKVVCDLADCESRLAELNEQVQQQEIEQNSILLPRYKKVKERSAPAFKIKEIIFCGKKILAQKDWITDSFPIGIAFSTNYTDQNGNFHTIPESYFKEDVQRLLNFNLSALVESLVKFRSEKIVGQKENLPNNQNDLKKWLDPDKYEGFYAWNPTDAYPHPQVMPAKEIPQSVLAAVGQISALFDSVNGRSSTAQMPGGLNASGDMVDSIAREDMESNSMLMDNLERMIEYINKVCLAALPVVYDSRREIDMKNKNKSASMEINNEEMPYTMIDDRQFEVSVETGPAFELQRQQVSTTLMNLVQINPQLLSIFGDIIVKNLNINDSEELSQRMNFVLNPGILQSLGIKLPAPPQNGPPPPSPVDMMKFQIEQKKLQLDQVDMQLKAQKAQSDAASAQAQQQLDMRKQQLDEEITMLDYQVKMAQVQSDGQANQVELQSNEMKTRAEILKAIESTHSAIHTENIKAMAARNNIKGA